MGSLVLFGKLKSKCFYRGNVPKQGWRWEVRGYHESQDEEKAGGNQSTCAWHLDTSVPDGKSCAGGRCVKGKEPTGALHKTDGGPGEDGPRKLN